MELAVDISIGETDLTTWVSSAMERWHVPGLTLSVLQNDTLRYAMAFGLADVEHSVPMTERTLMPVGSLTKSLLSSAVAVAVEKGQLDWDAPVKGYIPWFQMSDASVAEKASVRDFLCMRTGLAANDDHVLERHTRHGHEGRQVPS